MTKNCLVCFQPFNCAPRDAVKGRGKYCSLACYYGHKKLKIVELACAQCNILFKREAWRVNTKPMNRYFCSRSCTGKYKNGKELPRTAQNITREVLQKEYIEEGKTIKQIAAKYNCGYGTVQKRLWKFNIAQQSRLAIGKPTSHRYWSIYLNKKHNQTCQICGWNKAVCDMHHRVSQINGGTNTEDNLILVCPNCHRLIHKKLLKI